MISLLPLLLLNAPAQAYFCQSRTLADQVEASRYALYAEAVKERPLESVVVTAQGKLSRAVQINTIESFKGELPKSFWMNDGALELPGCGAKFHVGSRFLLFIKNANLDGVHCCDVMNVEKLTSQQRKELRNPRSILEQRKRVARENASSKDLYIAGTIAYRNQNYDEAQAEWEEALRRDPSNSDAKMGLKKLEKIRTARKGK